MMHLVLRHVARRRDEAGPGVVPVDQTRLCGVTQQIGNLARDGVVREELKSVIAIATSENAFRVSCAGVGGFRKLIEEELRKARQHSSHIRENEMQVIRHHNGSVHKNAEATRGFGQAIDELRCVFWSCAK
jgi:hypothetical protein